MAFEVNFNSLSPSLKATQTDRNVYINMTYDFVNGVPTYLVVHFLEVKYESNNITTFEQIRQFVDVDNRTLTVREDSGTGEIVVQDTPQVMIIGVPGMYSDYTFGSSGIIVITPDFEFGGNNQDINVEVVVEYQITEQSTGNVLGPWQESTTFTGIPIDKGDVNLQVKDVGWFYSASPGNITTVELGSFVEVPIIFTPDPDTISVISDLPAFSLSNDPMVVVTDSTTKLSQNMRYIFKMLDTNDDLVLTTSLYPDIDNSFYGIYDMSMLYNQYTTTDKSTWNNSTFYVTDNVYEFKYIVSDNEVSLGETSDTNYVIKGATSYGNFFDPTDYIDPNNVRKFLTSWVGDYSYRLDDYGSINFTRGEFKQEIGSTSINGIVITRYEKGQSLGYTTWADSDRILYMVGSNLLPNLVYNVPLAPKNLDEAFTANRITDIDGNVVNTNFLEDDSTVRYTITLIYKVITNIITRSEVRVINLQKDEVCWKYVPTTFLWKDDLGNYNSFTFNGRSMKEYTAKKTLTNKDYYGYKNDSWIYEISDRGRSNNDVRFNENHEVMSGWLDDNLMKNIVGIVKSNDVYVIGDTDIFPVIISTNKIDEKTVINNRLFNVGIKYTMAFDLNTNI